jgi:hypothetical protein
MSTRYPSHHFPTLSLHGIPNPITSHDYLDSKFLITIARTLSNKGYSSLHSGPFEKGQSLQQDAFVPT